MFWCCQNSWKSEVGQVEQVGPADEVVFQDADDEGDEPQRLISRKQNSTIIAEEVVIDTDEPPTLKRIKSAESVGLAGLKQSPLRVQTLGGEAVLSLTREEVEDLTVQQLRDMVVKALGVVEEVKLVFQLRELGEKELLKDLIKIEDPCNIQCVMQRLPQFDPEKAAVDQLDVLKGLLESASQDYQFQATTQIRKALSVEINPPIQEVIDSGVLERLVELAQKSEMPILQFEALWALTNVASGTAQQTQQVVELDGVRVFVDVLKFEVNNGVPEGAHFSALGMKNEVIDQALWALGNLAGDRPAYRDMCLERGILAPLLQILQWDTNVRSISVLRTACWTFKNCCRGKPAPAFEQFRPALPTLKALLSCADVEGKTDACWAVSYLTDGPNERIQAIVEAGFCPQLIFLLSSGESTLVTTPALRSIGNVVTGDDAHTQAALDSGLLEHLPTLLNHTKKALRKEAFWVLSNICGGNSSQIQAVIDSNLVPKMIEAMRNEDADVSKEATYCICNACSTSDPNQLADLALCVQPLLEHLWQQHDTRVQQIMLDGLVNICQQEQNLKSTSRKITKNTRNMGTVQSVFEDNPDYTKHLNALASDTDCDAVRSKAAVLASLLQDKKVSEFC